MQTWARSGLSCCAKYCCCSTDKQFANPSKMGFRVAVIEHGKTFGTTLGNRLDRRMEFDQCPELFGLCDGHSMRIEAAARTIGHASQSVINFIG